MFQGRVGFLRSLGSYFEKRLHPEGKITCIVLPIKIKSIEEDGKHDSERAHSMQVNVRGVICFGRETQKIEVIFREIRV